MNPASPTLLYAGTSAGLRRYRDTSLVEGAKPWTLLYYLAGDNDLDTAQQTLLNELQRYTNNPVFNVAVMIDGRGANDSQ